MVKIKQVSRTAGETGITLQEGFLLIEIFDANSPKREKDVADKIEQLLKDNYL